MSKGNTHIPTLGRVIVWEVSEEGGDRGWRKMGTWRGDGEGWRGHGRGVVGDGRWEMEEEWKERGMEGAGDLKKLNKFLKRKITTSFQEFNWGEPINWEGGLKGKISGFGSQLTDYQSTSRAEQARWSLIFFLFKKLPGSLMLNTWTVESTAATIWFLLTFHAMQYTGDPI